MTLVRDVAAVAPGRPRQSGSRTNMSPRRLLAPFAVSAILLVACSREGGSDARSESTTAPATASTHEAASTPASNTIPAVEGPTVQVLAGDYAFGGIPRSVTPGTRFSLTNVSDVEAHELVVLRVPDEELRSLEQLVALTREERDEVFGNRRPEFVLVAAPGSDIALAAIGDGTVTEPGRYLALCLVPRGADPQRYLDAVLETGAQEVEGGPSHAALGMYAEFTVER